jgi:hypothetical protein
MVSIKDIIKQPVVRNVKEWATLVDQECYDKLQMYAAKERGVESFIYENGEPVSIGDYMVTVFVSDPVKQNTYSCTFVKESHLYDGTYGKCYFRIRDNGHIEAIPFVERIVVEYA